MSYFYNYFSEEKVATYFRFLPFVEFDQRGEVDIYREFRAMNKRQIEHFIAICKTIIDCNFFLSEGFYIEFNSSYTKVRKYYYSSGCIGTNEFNWRIDVVNENLNVIDVINCNLGIERGFVPIIKQPIVEKIIPSIKTDEQTNLQL